MKSFKKNYIGKGTQVENYNIVKVTVKKKDLVSPAPEGESAAQQQLLFEF